jgi:indoleamine 2,3-dioxygenase
LTNYLKKLAVQIDRIGDITLSMIKEVDPEEFYHLIRPWFKGGDGDGPGSVGWRFMGVDEELGSAAENKADEVTGKGKLFSGPSAGQSSLIHAIDIFLTVDHATDEQVAVQTAIDPTHPPAKVFNTANTPITSDSTETTPPTKPNEATFVQRMLQYMPLAHRTFLLHLSTHPTPIRQLVILHAKTHPKLAESYDTALDALKRFREKHMRVVSVFIVQQARRKPSERIAKLLGVEHDGDDGSVSVNVVVGELRGTGGSPLFKFLKRCRDNTMRARINQSAGPVYDLEKGKDV